MVVHLDDTVLHSKTLQESFQYTTVLGITESRSTFQQAEYTLFGAVSVEDLLKSLIQDGTNAAWQRFQAACDWSVSKAKSKAQSFLETVGHYTILVEINLNPPNYLLFSEAEIFQVHRTAYFVV